APVAPTTFRTDIFFNNLNTMPHNFNLNGILPNGAPATLSISSAPGPVALFEGQQLSTVQSTLTIKLGTTPLGSDTVIGFVDLPTRTYRGAVYLDGKYEVATIYSPIPALAKIGDAGPLIAATTYTSDTKSIIDSKTIGTYSVEAAAGTTAYFCNNSTITYASRTDNGSTCYRIDANGNILSLKFTLRIGNDAVVFQ
ncbi:MAG: hypothetical protein WCD07_07680, partial [Burkholderiales bacterium]